MNDLQILNAVTAKFSSEFSSCPIEFPNTRLDSRLLDTWVRISVTQYKSLRINLIDGIMRRGCVNIQVFEKHDNGAGSAMLTAFLASKVFELQSIGRLRFGVAHVNTIGSGLTDSPNSDDTNWFQINVLIDYEVIS